MTIRPKNPDEIAIMRRSGAILSDVLKQTYEFATVGKNLLEIDTFAHDLIIKAGATPSFLGYMGFPASTCLSLNAEVVHGIPHDYILQDGDELGIDIGVLYQGYHTDAAATKAIGKVSPQIKNLLAVTQQALAVALESAIAGNVVSDIGRAVEEYVTSQGQYGIVRDLAGHGVGQKLQEAPEVLNYYRKNDTPLVNGMTLAIEPMLTLGTWKVWVEDDDWTVVTQDDKPTAQFETTVVINNNDPEILVPFPLDVRL